MTDRRDRQNRDKEREHSASGLDETQIEKADLEHFQQATVLRQVDTQITCPVHQLEMGWIEPGLPGTSIKHARVEFAPRKPIRMRFALLPNRINVSKLKPPATSLRLRRALSIAGMQPIRRDKLDLRFMSREFESRLDHKLKERFGAGIDSVEILGVFPHVPPEAAETVQVDSELRWATFTWSSKLNPAKALPDFFLIIFRDQDQRTKKLLVRL